MSYGFVRLTLLLHRTRMRREIQAEQVFKYYRLPKKKIVVLGGSLEKCDYCKRSNQGERQSCNKIRS